MQRDRHKAIVRGIVDVLVMILFGGFMGYGLSLAFSNTIPSWIPNWLVVREPKSSSTPAALVVVIFVAGLFVSTAVAGILWPPAYRKRTNPLARVWRSLLLAAIEQLALVMVFLPIVFPSSSLADLWSRYVAPLWQHGTLFDFGKAIAVVGLGLILLVVIPRLVAMRAARSPRWLPLPLLRYLVRSGVTLLDVVLLAVGLYGGYWLGLFHRTVATDAFVASMGAASAKIAIAGAIVFVKGLVGGAGTAAGGYVVVRAIKAHSGPPDAAQE